MKFCIECGSSSVRYTIPPGDDKPRFICSDCSYIFYQNPRMICGTLPVYEDKILLCKREIEPRAGCWTLPAGFMENQETIEEASLRETLEEALVVGLDPQLYTIISLPHINQVHIFYRCTIKDGFYGPGSETTDTQLFHPDEIPWEDLAFLTVRRCLEVYLEDLKTGQFLLRTEDIRTTPFRTSQKE